MQCLLLTVAMYWLIGFQDGQGNSLIVRNYYLPIGIARVLYFLLNHFLFYLFGFSSLLFVSALTPTAFYVGMIIPPIQTILLLVNGFTIPVHLMNKLWVWLYWASPAKWAFEGLLINEFGGGISVFCREAEMVPPLLVATQPFQGSQVEKKRRDGNSAC